MTVALITVILPLGARLWLMNLLDLIFPKYCVGCKREGEYFCQKCLTGIKLVSQICPVCEKVTPFGQTHPRCENRYSLDGLTSFFTYEGTIKEAIHKLKYRYATDLLKDLMKLVFLNYGKEIEEKYLLFERFVKEKSPRIVPIPLYWYKENTRGFNQAGLIGKFLSRKFNLPINDKVLKRKKFTVSQTTLSEEQRHKNVRDIFSFSPNILISQYPNILLVDDVWTTGSTIKEAASVLKRAGVKEVWGLTIAR